jgi:hypothetical protein
MKAAAMTADTPKTSDKPAEETLPAKGGSYVRNPDGSLQQVEGTKPAAPKLASNPPAPTDAKE